MKKLLLILLCLPMISLNNLSYASFPVIEHESTLELVDSEKREIESPVKDTPLGNWSLVLGLLWFPLLFLAFMYAWDGPEEYVMFFLVASIASFIGAIITGIQSLNSGETPKWKAYVGLGITLSIFLIVFLSIYPIMFH